MPALLAQYDFGEILQFVILVAIFILAPLAKKLIQMFSPKQPDEVAPEGKPTRQRVPRPVARPLPPTTIERQIESPRPVSRPLPPSAEVGPQGEKPATSLPEVIFEMLGVPVPEELKKRRQAADEPPAPAAPAQRKVRRTGPARRDGEKVRSERHAERQESAHRRTKVAESPPAPRQAGESAAPPRTDREITDEAFTKAYAQYEQGGLDFDRRELLTRQAARRAIILTEILGPPRSLHPYEDRF